MGAEGKDDGDDLVAHFPGCAFADFADLARGVHSGNVWGLAVV
jgi:hypothetical protein